MGADDPLASLLGGVRRQKQRDGDLDFSRREKNPNSSGLNPLDILALPASQRDTINWLSRRKQATLDELQAALNKPPEEVTTILDKLKIEGYIREALIDGQLYYRVAFGGKVSRTGRGMPSTLWNAVDLENGAFLLQLPLFSDLPPDELEAFASQCESREYRRNEVLLWQGHLVNDVLFVKNGLVGITRLMPGSSEGQMVAYLKQGDMLGEMSLLREQNTTAGATATALSEVTVLAIGREKFKTFLKNNRRAALELSRIILQRLMATNSRLVSSGLDPRLAIVFGVGENSGHTMLGAALAMTLGQVTQSRAVYTEHPDPRHLQGKFAWNAERVYHRQPGAYDVAGIIPVAGMPLTVRTTLVLDQLMGDYTNVVMGVPGEVDEAVNNILEEANQLVLVFSPEPESIAPLEALMEQLRGFLHPEKTNTFIVANHTRPGLSLEDLPVRVDFEIPYFGHNIEPIHAVTLDELPLPVSKVADILADRLGRTNQIGVYIPAAVDDATIDPTNFVQETLSFLGSLFGGATASSTEAQSSVSNEDEAAAPEMLHVIRTYVTKVDLDRHLGQVLEYIEYLKNELGQDAMAMEVNSRLMVI